ncbi:MAG: hypothetical protein ACHREM_27770, partial [Polyangiales bacterium]
TWHLVGADDLARLAAADFDFVKTTLTSTSGSAYFFALQVIARAADGTIAVDDLTPGVSTRITPFPAGTDLTLHYEGGLALRCIKFADAP